MFESPRSLQEFCIDYICDNVMALCEFHPQEGNGVPSNCSTLPCIGKIKDIIAIDNFITSIFYL